MTAAQRNLAGWWSDARGQMAVEYTLLLGAFGIPMIYVFSVLLKVLAEHYRMLTFLETLPFP